MSEETLASNLKLAIQYQQENRWQEAEEIYRGILAQQSQNYEALHGLAVVTQKAGDLSSAEQLFRQALTSQPQALKTWFSLGNLYYVQNKLPEAEDCYLKVIELQPNLVSVYNNLGYVRQQQGKLSEAIATYQKALEIEPTCVESELSLANIFHSQGKLSDEEKALYAAKNNEQGINRKLAGDYQTAIAYYRQAIALQPNLAIAHYNLAVALELQGEDLEASTVHYQNIIDLDHASSSVFGQLAAYRLKKRERLAQIAAKSPTQSRLKMAFICQPWTPTNLRQPQDSINIIICELAHRLALECDVTVYAPNFPGQPEREDRYRGVVYRYLSVDRDNQLLAQEQPNTSERLIALDNFYQNYIQNIAADMQQQGFDIAHIHNLSQFILPIRAVNPQIKIVLHMNCDWLEYLDYDQLVTRLQSADLILGASQYITETIQQRFEQYATRCQTLFNGVNIHRYLNGSVEQVNSTGDRQQSIKRLLFVGRVCPVKGSHVLLDAFKQVLQQRDDVELTLVGPVGVINSQFLVSLEQDPQLRPILPFHERGGAVWMEHLKASLAELNSQQETKPVNKVLLPGAVSPDRLAGYYYRADIFIFPSVWQEAFGMPVAEAMVSGTPVITTSTGALGQLIEDGKSGLVVEPGNADELAAAILRLLDDPDLSKTFGEAGCRRGVELFSFDRLTDDLLEKYRQLI